MDYERIYNAIIDKRRNDTPEGYSENHHIVPVSFGGPDTPENLVCLTAREHFLCHWLLTKMYFSGRLHYKAMHALIAMSWLQSKNHQRNRCTARMYENLKHQHSMLMSEWQQGNQNSMYGTCWIWHELIGSKTIKYNMLPYYMEQGWYKGRNLKFEKMVPVEVRVKQRKQSAKIAGMKKRGKLGTFKGRTHTKETKQIQSAKAKERLSDPTKNSQYGTMWITDGVSNRKIKKDIDIIPEGWYNGRSMGG